MSDEIHVQLGSTYYALTLDGARRKAQRIVERLNHREELDVPIARTVEVRPADDHDRLPTQPTVMEPIVSVMVCLLPDLRPASSTVQPTVPDPGSDGALLPVVVRRAVDAEYENSDENARSDEPPAGRATRLGVVVSTGNDLIKANAIRVLRR